MTGAPPVRGFRGEHWFLSNFWSAPVVLDGRAYPTVEHAYQAAKTLDPATRERIRAAGTPGEAKRLGRGTAAVRPDWDAAKRTVMLDLLRQKFRRDPLRAQLLATGGAHLEETNAWGDTYWGVCDGAGENHLGYLLMRVRAELRAHAAAQEGAAP